MAIIYIITGILLSTYSEKIKDIDSYTIFTATPDVSFTIEPKRTSDKVHYRPNVHSFTGMAINYKGISFAIATQNTDKEKDSIPRSRTLDLQFFSHYKNFVWEVYYQNYSGLYIGKSNNLEFSKYSANSYSYGGGVKFFTDKTFSPNQSIGIFSKNKVSNWSGVYGLNINKSRLSSSSGLIPDEYDFSLSKYSQLVAIESDSFSIEGGITGLYSPSDEWFISGLLSISLISQQQRFTGFNSKSEFSTNIGSSAILEIGKKFKKNHQIGYFVRSINKTVSDDDIDLQQSTSYNSIYYKYFF